MFRENANFHKFQTPILQGQTNKYRRGKLGYVQILTIMQLISGISNIP
jgi:hypothetical protein